MNYYNICIALDYLSLLIFVQKLWCNIHKKKIEMLMRFVCVPVCE